MLESAWQIGTPRYEQPEPLVGTSTEVHESDAAAAPSCSLDGIRLDEPMHLDSDTQALDMLARLA